MLDIAIKYTEELNRLFRDMWFKDRYKFWNANSYYNNFQPVEDTWNEHQFVSVDNSGDIVGYIGYSIDRDTYSVSGMSIMNFTRNKIIFGTDLRQVLVDIFEKFKFNKIIFSVIVGNPVENTYDKMVTKYGGRIVGYYKQDAKLFDNRLYDRKLYEILRSDYLRMIERKVEE